MLLSLIVTTYNRPDALLALLAGVDDQDDRDFEVIVTDDGSGAATSRVMADWRATVPVRYVWQEDRGFRAGSARNRGIAAAKGEYLIFLDGDCVPRSNFISRHRRLAQPGWFVAGNRVLLSKALTAKVEKQNVQIQNWSLSRWGVARLKGDINRFLPLIKLPGRSWRQINDLGWKGVISCNLAAWRSDLLEINGFDERYQGWGREDSDLVIRLLRQGVRHCSGIFSTGVLHLWHPESDRTSLLANDQLLAETMSSKTNWAAQGLDKYL